MLSEQQKAQMSDNAQRAEALMKLLANQYRLQILCTLVTGEKSAGELEDNLNISQSAVSQHLAKLRKAEVVVAEKRGQMIFYRLASMEVQAILSTLYLIYCK